MCMQKELQIEVVKHRHKYACPCFSSQVIWALLPLKIQIHNTQQVLGKEDLRDISLIEVTFIPMDTRLWLNYTDVITTLPGHKTHRVTSLSGVERAFYATGSSPLHATSRSFYGGSSAEQRFHVSSLMNRLDFVTTTQLLSQVNSR